MDRLRALDLSWNPLSSIEPEAFQSSPLLTNLTCAYCSLSHLLRELFAHTLSLRVLILTGNRIAEITDEDLFYPRALEVLLLDHNRIRVVHPRAFLQLTKLRHLSLAYNSLATLDSFHSDRFRALDVLRVEGNAWHCDCRLHWLKQLTTDRQRVSVSFYDERETRCASADMPGAAHAAGVVNRTWEELAYQQFACMPRLLAHVARAITPSDEARVSDNIDLSRRGAQGSAGGANSNSSLHSSAVSVSSTSSDSVLQLTGEGSSVILICQIQDTPKRFLVRWKRDNLDMSSAFSDNVHCPRNSSSPSSSKTKLEPSTKWFLCTGISNASRNHTFISALVLRRATAADASRYTCEYRNALGVTSHTFTLYPTGAAFGSVEASGDRHSDSSRAQLDAATSGSTPDSLLLALLLGARARIFLGLVSLFFVVALVLATVCFMCKLAHRNRQFARGAGERAQGGSSKEEMKNTLANTTDMERPQQQPPRNGSAGSYAANAVSTAGLPSYPAKLSFAQADGNLAVVNGDVALASLSNGGSLMRGSGGSRGAIEMGLGAQSSDSEVSFTENELASLPLPPPPPPPALEALASAHRADKQVTFDVSGPAPGESPCPVHGLSPLFRYDLPMKSPKPVPLEWPAPPSPLVTADVAALRERQRSNPDLVQLESDASTPLISSTTCPLHGVHTASAPNGDVGLFSHPTSSCSRPQQPALVQSQTNDAIVQRLFSSTNAVVQSYTSSIPMFADVPIAPRAAPTQQIQQMQLLPFRDDQRLVSAPVSDRPLSAAIGTHTNTPINKYATLGVGVGVGVGMSAAQRLRFPSALQPLLESQSQRVSAPSSSSSASAGASASAEASSGANCSASGSLRPSTTRSSPHVKFASFGVANSSGGSFESGEESSLVLTPFDSVV